MDFFRLKVIKVIRVFKGLASKKGCIDPSIFQGLVDFAEVNTLRNKYGKKNLAADSYLDHKVKPFHRFFSCFQKYHKLIRYNRSKWHLTCLFLKITLCIKHLNGTWIAPKCHWVQKDKTIVEKGRNIFYWQKCHISFYFPLCGDALCVVASKPRLQGARLNPSSVVRNQDPFSITSHRCFINPKSNLLSW